MSFADLATVLGALIVNLLSIGVIYGRMAADIRNLEKGHEMLRDDIKALSAQLTNLLTTQWERRKI